MRSDLHDVDVIYQTQTEKAVCVKAYEGAPDVWVPLSQCQIEHRDGEGAELRRGSVAVLTASESLLIDKGLI